jgi:pilus assembly protein CpaE
VRPDHAGAVGPEFISEVLAILRSMSDFVVVDTPAGFSAEVITAVDNSTQLVVVGMLDAFSLKDTKLGLETLDRMGYDRGSIRVVLNRADTHVGIGKDDVTGILDREPDVLVPSQREIPRSVTQGTPIVTAQPKSIAARSFRNLAALYTSRPAPSAETNGAAAVPASRRKTLLLRRA